MYETYECPHCHKTFSSPVGQCPNCKTFFGGVKEKPSPRPKLASALGGLALLVLGLFAAALLVGFAMGGYELLRKEFHHHKEYIPPNDPRVVQSNIAKLKDKDSSVRYGAVQELWFATDDPQAIAALVGALKDPDWTVRREAISVLTDPLRRENYPVPVEAIIAALEDENLFVRTEAATVLGPLHDLRAVEPLIKTLQNDTEEIVRQKAAFALGVLRDPRAVEALTRALEDKSPSVHKIASEALEKIRQQ